MSSKKYRIPIEYRLVLTNSSTEADIVLSKGSDGKIKGIVLEVPKDVNRTHPYLQRDVVRELNERLENGVTFNQYDFQAILFKEKIRDNAKYYQLLKNPLIHKYSKDLVIFILDKIKENPDYLKAARISYSRSKMK